MVVGTQPRCLLEFRGLGHTEIPLGREAMLPQPGSVSGCRGGEGLWPRRVRKVALGAIREVGEAELRECGRWCW